MDDKVKKNLLDIVMMWIVVGAALTLPASCMKAVSSFYHQVIVKDSVAGQSITK